MPAKNSTPPTIAWDDRLATGLPDVDAQHRQLFDIVNHLGELYAKGVTSEQLFSILNELKQYATTHFNTEETLMVQHKIGRAHHESHQQAHREFINHIQRTSALAAANPEATVNLLLAFLSQWLLHHVANMDQLMADEIRVLQSGSTSGQIAGERQPHRDALMENINAIYRDLGDRTFRMLELNLQLQSEIERRKQLEQELFESKTRFRTVADHTHSWEYWQGEDRRIVYMSPSCERITGYAPSEFMADPELLYHIIHPEDRHLMRAHQHDIHFAEQGEDEIGFRIQHRNGETRWIIHACKSLHDSDGQFIGRRGSNRDITERRSQGDSMMLAAAIFESVNEAVVVMAADGRIVAVNSSFFVLSDYSYDEVIGQHPAHVFSTMLAPAIYKEIVSSVCANSSWQGEISVRHRDGTPHIISLSVHCVRDDSGYVSNNVAVFSDITERKESERRIHHLSNYDQLTGLPNWGLFSDRLQQALSVARHGRQPLALMFVDIDHFKSTKDKLGMEASEQLLRELARRIQECLRETDTAARIGSDEFLVLLPSTQSATVASEIADLILRKISQPFELGQHSVCISASIGITMHPEHGSEPEQLLRNADLAVYQAKQAGGAMVLTFTDPGDWLGKFRTGKTSA